MAITPQQTINKYILIAFVVLIAVDLTGNYLFPPAVIPTPQQNKSQTENSKKATDGETKKNFNEEFEKFQKAQSQEKAEEKPNQNKRSNDDDEEQQELKTKRPRKNSKLEDEQQDNEEPEVPKKQKSSNQKRRNLELQVQYCASGNFKGKFEEIQKSLTEMSDQFPGLEVYGVEYPNSPQNELAIKAVTYLQYGSLLFSVLGDKIFGWLHMEYPKWYLLFKEKQYVAFFIFYIGGNYVRGAMNSGAFEVYVDNKLIYSKLNSKQLPNVGEIIRLLEIKYKQ